MFPPRGAGQQGTWWHFSTTTEHDPVRSTRMDIFPTHLLPTQMLPSSLLPPSSRSSLRPHLQEIVSQSQRGHALAVPGYTHRAMASLLTSLGQTTFATARNRPFPSVNGKPLKASTRGGLGWHETPTRPYRHRCHLESAKHGK